MHLLISLLCTRHCAKWWWRTRRFGGKAVRLASWGRRMHTRCGTNSCNPREQVENCEEGVETSSLVIHKQMVSLPLQATPSNFAFSHWAHEKENNSTALKWTVCATRKTMQLYRVGTNNTSCWSNKQFAEKHVFLQITIPTRCLMSAQSWLQHKVKVIRAAVWCTLITVRCLHACTTHTQGG